MALRQATGVRSDVSFVIAASLDRQAIMNGQSSGRGFPIYDWELLELEDRVRRGNEVAGAIRQYGKNHSAEFAGVYVDQAAGGVVVALFTDRLIDHERALKGLLGSGAMFDVRPAQWSYAELDALAERVLRESHWFPSIGAEWRGSGVDELNNVVDVQLRSDRSDAATLTIAHFAASGKMSVTISGAAPWTGGFGLLEVIVLEADGTPATGGTCWLHALEAGVMDDDDLRGVDGSGRCLFDGAPATTVRISVERESPAEGVAHVDVTVVRGAETRVTVRLPGP